MGARVTSRGIYARLRTRSVASLVRHFPPSGLVVDGTRVIDNWTHHAPTEDVATVTLDAGVHEIEVRHFELDGWAHLEVWLEPVS